MTEEEVVKIIGQLKLVKSHVDVIPVKLFKSLAPIIASPLSNIINSSFQNSIFPDLLKIARVVPIFKSGDQSDPTNYRTISCFPYIGKIFEKCISSRILSFCCKYQIFSKSQFGFLKGKTTSDALIDLTDFIYNSLDKKEHNVTFLVDLKKAFDTVNHSILLRKLEQYGFRGKILNWMASYISNRRCFVEIEGKKSSEFELKVGIQQGSVLGPILFLLYINDLPLVSQTFKTTLFADDTTFSYSDNSFNYLILNSNAELSKIHDWTIRNRLTINVDKTEAILITNRNYESGEQRLKIGNKHVEFVESCKFLGIHLDS